MSSRVKRGSRKDQLLFELDLLWSYDTPANIARRLGYKRLDYLLRTLDRWPEGKVWYRRLMEADTLQRGRDARSQPLDKAS